MTGGTTYYFLAASSCVLAVKDSGVMPDLGALEGQIARCYRARNNPPMVHCESITDHVDYRHSVWYTFTASDDFNYLDIDTEESSYDTVVAVYTGSKGNLTQIACNDDDPERRLP